MKETDAVNEKHVLMFETESDCDFFNFFILI